MSLSFKDSLANNTTNTSNIANPVAPKARMMSNELLETATVMAYSLDDVSAFANENWTKIQGYKSYDGEYKDENYSTVDELKNIVLDSKQFNITQEKNSQYIPFQMPRYYDGFDLTNTRLSIYYVNENKDAHADIPVDVYYNDDYIRFAWLVSEFATQVAGILKFEIHADGVNSMGDPYTWKSKSIDKLNVIQSLEDIALGDIGVSEEELKSYYNLIQAETGKAQQAASESQKALNETTKLVADLKDGIAEEVETAVDARVETVVDIKISNQLLNYYTKAETNIEISDRLGGLGTNVDGSEKTAKQYVDSAVDTINKRFGTLTDSDGIVLTVEEYVKQEVDAVDVSDELGDLGTNEDGSTKTVVQFVNEVVDAVDISDKLGNLGVNDSGEELTVKEYVDNSVDAIDISDRLGELGTNEDDTPKTVKEYVDNAVSNVSVDLTGYATETYVDNKTDVLSDSIDVNRTNISSLSTVVGDLQTEVNSIDTSPRKTYDIIYDDTEDENGGENVLVFYEIENENKEDEVKLLKRRYVITGGSGGSASANDLVLYYDTDQDGNNITSYVFTTENFKNKEAVINYDFSGTDSAGDSVPYANGTWQVRKGTSGAWSTIKTETIYPNTDIQFNVSEYISSIGTYSLRLSVSDDTNGYASKTWTIQYIDFRIESDFNDKLTYPIGTVLFGYTPNGNVSKDIHFVLDDKEISPVTTSSSGIPMTYEIPAQTHGSHLLEVYMTSTINGNDIESNHILRDIIWYDEASDVPVIGTVYQNFTARQYDTTNIEYTVYDSSTETPTVTIAVDGEVVSTPMLTTSTAIYPYKEMEAGTHTITITCGETIKTLIATIEKLDINVTPVTAGLVFDFNPVGKSNNDIDRVWKTDAIAMTVSENFDWINGGYQIDSNGDQYFCIKAGTSAEIDYQMFADDAKKNGKEMKLVFKTTNVAKPNARFLHCIDNTTGDNNIGIEMFSQEAYIYGQASDKLHLPYSEEDVIEFEFNISKDTESIPMVMGYEDGVSTRPMVYDDSYNFTQNTPKIISLGSNDCDLHIYRFKVYNTSLTARGILSNFIADARNAEEMISRYNRNQIYDENNQLDPDILAEKCPWLRVYKLSAPYFTNNKSDKVPNTTIQQIYKDGDPVLDNWTCYDCSHSGQGTSSNNYGAAGRNLDFIMNKSQIEGIKPYFILGDGSRAKEITLTRTSVPVAYLNAKVNIASSNNLTNAMLAGRYNEFNPYNRSFVRDEGVDTSFIKDCMEFYNCVIFIQETNTDISTHREFEDNNWHFYAIGNIGDSKKSDSTRLTDMGDKHECCIEVMDVGRALSDFPVDTMMNAMGYKEDEITKEKIYTWAKDENLGILYEKINNEYVLTQDTTVDLSKIYYVDILLHDDFSENYTYGWRYVYEDGTDEENAEAAEYCHQKWIDFYRFVTTSTNKEFKAHLGDYFVVDSALYYYLFTTRYCMVDNRAKNSFYHYGKTGEVDTDGNPIYKWDLAWAYDMDTSLGLNNYGAQVYRYGLEDTDVDEGGQEVFRESDSKFFCRIRDLFENELKVMYNTLESQNAWHGESFINKADEWQSQFPEELWRLDIERKYIRTYNSSFIDGEGDDTFLTTMANGKMKYHRRQWERNQEKYMASKYQSSDAGSDEESVIIRCASISNELKDDMVIPPSYSLTLTPYAYMYLNVQYGDNTSPISLRAEPNVAYEIPCINNSLDGIKVYSSSMLQSIGDISACYATVVRVKNASKLNELIVGNETEGYDNPYLTTLDFGSNYLLEKLNIENVSGYAGSLNLSVLNNLKELYAHGTNTSGVTFADGGLIEIAELPAINTMKMKNLMYLVNLDVTSFNKLTSMTVENCNTVDLVNILDNALNINRVRIIGIDWTLEDTSLLERLYGMSGFDGNGYNTDQSVLTGAVYVSTIKEQDLIKYENAWSDLIIDYGSVIPQYPVTFMNADGTVLEVQYVVSGENAVDPTTRDENRIIPTLESTISYDYTFAGWDYPNRLLGVSGKRTITATYTESLRKYTIKYISNPTGRKPITMYEYTGEYGSNISYPSDYAQPSYTDEEVSNKYYLFKRWDKSGFLDGGFDENDTKIVNAIFDELQIPSIDTYFESKELKDLTPVEIYAITKINTRRTSGTTINNDPYYYKFAESIITDFDEYSITVGNDVDYDDIESNVLISEKTYFDGTNYIDFDGTDYPEVKLFNEDKDFVLAIDYEVSSENKTGAILAQCYNPSGKTGFKLGYNSGAQFTWESKSEGISAVNKREIVVIRHIKGQNNLIIYKSNLDGTSVTTSQFIGTKNSISESTLTFGCEKDSVGIYINYAIGNINWAKIWYKDLGENACNSLAEWTHESIKLNACGFKRYLLSDGSGNLCSFSLLASHLLDRTQQWNSSRSNTGGWAESKLNKSLNTRLYRAIPTQIKALLKQVVVWSSIGDNSSELSSSDCYITIPAISEVSPSQDFTVEPYNSEGTSISYMGENETRKRAFDGGEYNDYWTRSPNKRDSGTAYYVWRVDKDGSTDNMKGITSPSDSFGVLIMISF